ncbi:MAG: hypothetical protein NC831_06365 [Candidatus Omnitrophica bacterium]|nr:hypothetical protein [Candidatus Omnitrophota bacterium]MCM8829335.1 hypothetical protein [Candidatus Omnitrophota bacterium]
METHDKMVEKIFSVKPGGKTEQCLLNQWHHNRNKKKRRYVSTKYEVLNRNTYGFAVKNDYNQNKPPVIDAELDVSVYLHIPGNRW